MPPLLPLISDYPFHYAAERPTAEALVWPGEHAGQLPEQRLTYAEYAAGIEQCAKALLAAGVRRGDRVALLSTPRPEFLILYMATARIGAIFLGLNPRYRAAELAFVINDATPAMVFTLAAFEGRDYAADWAQLRSGEAAEALAETPMVILGDATTGAVVDAGAAPETMNWDEFMDAASQVSATDYLAAVTAVQPQDPALIVYTSGSTGHPKGALLSHRGIVTTAHTQCQHWWADPFRILFNMPINHVGGAVQIACHALVAGGTNVLVERFDPVATPKIIERERISVIHQVATMYQLILERGDIGTADLSSLQTIIWSGAPASAVLIQDLRRLTPRLSTSYGSTECGGEVLYSPAGESDEVLAETVGLPDPHLAVRLADDRGQLVAEGERGEIQTRGPHVMLGYFNRPDATRDAFTADGWLHTGDLGEVRADGRYRIVGRLKEMFKSGGYNIYPREIEAVLESYPGVSAAVVVDVPDELYAEVGFAWLLQEADQAPDLDALRAFCHEQLANYKVPKYFSFCAEWPMLPIGKVDRKALREQAAAASQVEGAAPGVTAGTQSDGTTVTQSDGTTVTYDDVTAAVSRGPS